MDLEGIKQKISRDFAGKTEKLDPIRLKAKNYQDLAKLAELSGDATADVLIGNLPESEAVTESDAVALVPHALRLNHAYLASPIEDVQAGINGKVGVGLKPVVPEFNADRAVGLAKELVRWGDIGDRLDKFRQQVVNNSASIVDEAIQGNMRQHDAVGLETVVTREYDGVGLHDGKEPCAWCLARAGVWSYADAVTNGVFERHPGCGCTLTYTTERGTDVQTDWTSNTWTRIRR